MSISKAVAFRYWQERKAGHGAKTALLQAKWTERPEYTIASDLLERSESRGMWAEHGTTDGLTVRVLVRPDDLSTEDAGYGTFTSDESKLRSGDGAYAFQGKSSREHHIYVPEFGLAERIDAYHQAGWHVAPARLQAMKDIRDECRAARDWNGGSYIQVEIRIEDVVIIEESCGGCGPEAGIEFVMEQMREGQRAVTSGEAADIVKAEAKRAARDAGASWRVRRLSRRLATKARTAVRKRS